MIDAVTLSNLRGVVTGGLADLPPLTVLVGRNGAGKSTVLEALAIGGAHQPAVLVGQVVQHRHGWRGASYLVARGASEARIQCAFSGGEQRTVTLWYDEQPTGLTLDELPPGPAPGPAGGPYVGVRLAVERAGVFNAGPGARDPAARLEARTIFDLRNEYRAALLQGLGQEDRVRLVHPAAARAFPLWKTLGDAVKSGRADAVFALLRDLLGDDFRDLYPIQESEDGQMTNVHLRFGWGTVPVDVAGDGVRALVRIALELAGRPESVILLEEPELHQHPGALVMTARALLAAAARGVQVVLSTHSLELIDALVDQADGEALDRLAVYRLALPRGELRTHRVAGQRVAALRQQLAEDLR